jgi:ABC-2 type transport system ATP-binding protein
MKVDRSKPWFVRRNIGLGWRPASWQAWAVAAPLVVVTGGVVAAVGNSAARLAVIVAAGAVYALIAAMTSGGRAGDLESDSHESDAAERPVARDAPARRDRPALALVSPAPAASERPPTARRRTSSGGHGRAAIVVDHLTKRFGERTAVDAVSFTVGYGEVFGFLGPNGAGKTTTVRTLGTLIEPTSGSAVIAGIPLSAANGVEIRRRISIMPESPGLYLRLTVRENLEFFSGLYGFRDCQLRIVQALEAVGLRHRLNDPCGSLSKGLRQRAAMARALLNDPNILFLDEPTAGLDPVAAREVHNLIDGLRDRGVTIFLTTHRLEEAERLCDRVAILNSSLRTIGRPDELEKQLFHKSLAVKTVAPLGDPAGLFARLPGVQSWQADAPGEYRLEVTDPAAAAPVVTRALVETGADVVSIGEARHSLEDVYLELVEEDVEAVRS